MPEVVFLGAVGEVFEFEAGAVLAGAGNVDGLGGVEGFLEGVGVDFVWSVPAKVDTRIRRRVRICL